MNEYKSETNYEDMSCFGFLGGIQHADKKNETQNDPNFNRKIKYQISKISDYKNTDENMLLKQIYVLSYSLAYKIETKKSDFFDIEKIIELIVELLELDSHEIISAALHCLSNIIFYSGKSSAPMVEKYNLFEKMIALFDRDISVDVLTNALSCINNMLSIKSDLKNRILDNLDLDQLKEIAIADPASVQFICEIFNRIISLMEVDLGFFYQIIGMFQSVHAEYKKYPFSKKYIDTYTSIMILFCNIFRQKSSTYMILVDTDIPSLAISKIALENEGLSMAILVFLSQAFAMKSRDLSAALYREINIDQLALFASVASESEKAVALNVTADLMALYPEAAHLECIVNLYNNALESAFEGQAGIRGCCLGFICRLFTHASDSAKEYMCKNGCTRALAEALSANINCSLPAAEVFVNFASVNEIDQEDIEILSEALEEFSEIHEGEYIASKAMVLLGLLNEGKENE